MAAPVADSLTPNQLNNLIQLPPGEAPLPRYDPNAGHDPKAATPEDVDKMLAELPQANKADTQSDDPNAALMANLKALQDELQGTIDAQEKMALAQPGQAEYVFEADDLCLAVVLKLKSGGTYMMQFKKQEMVRRGKLTTRGVWRSSWLDEANAEKVEEIVAALKRVDDFRYGRIKPREAADAEDVAGEITRLRGALSRRGQENVPHAGPVDQTFEEGMRAVPRIARTMQLPKQ